MNSTLVLPMPFDAHVHVRRGPMMSKVLKYTARQFGVGLLMPNTEPGIFSASDVEAYRSEVLSELNGEPFEPLMSIKLLDTTTPAMIFEAHRVGAVAAKLYPRGVTTNSADGVENITGLDPVFRALRKCGMLLLIHGEHALAYYPEAEEQFLPIVETIHKAYPQLRTVLEHVSTEAGVNLVRRLGPRVGATITIHHMVLTGNDVAKGKFRPHYYCLPIAKRISDREAVLAAALSGNPKFFLGTDSAPHLVGKKECTECCGGIFTAPYALEYLATIFANNARLDMLPNFAARFGCQHYGIAQPSGGVELVREDWWPEEDELEGVKVFKHPAIQPLQFKFVRKVS